MANFVREPAFKSLFRSLESTCSFGRYILQSIYVDEETRRYTEKDGDPSSPLVQRQLLWRLVAISGIFVTSPMFVAFVCPFLLSNDSSKHLTMLLLCPNQQNVGQFPGHCSLCWRERKPRVGKWQLKWRKLVGKILVWHTCPGQWMLCCFNKIIVNREQKREVGFVSSEWRGLARIIVF